MKDTLEDLYDPQQFKNFGTNLIELIANYLQCSHTGDVKVNNWISPKEQLEFWRNYELDGDSPQKLFTDILERSVNVHSPTYMGHQISPTAPLAALTGLLSAILNNGMAVYEMGAAGTAIEKIVIDMIAEKIGYGLDADGFITSGGSLANLTALLAAKKTMTVANAPIDRLAVMVSSEAHYSIEKSLRVMGIKDNNVIKVPVNDQFKMRTELLDAMYSQATSSGKKVFAIVGCAPSTSTGIHDDLQAIARFCKEKSCWFHVDAAHGGGAIFSDKYKYLLQGIQRADSVVIDGHKMLLMPSIMSFLIFKNKQRSYAAFQQKAVYLWEKEDEDDWYNLAKRTFECTKSLMSIQFYVILKVYGEQVFDQFVTKLYDLGQIFAEEINSRKHFELCLEPQSNIVCFRYKADGLESAGLNHLNSEIRTKLLHDGNFYIVQTIVNHSVYLRCTLMNPKTTKKIIGTLLNKIQSLANMIADK